MNHQDWKPVILNSKNKKTRKTYSDSTKPKKAVDDIPKKKSLPKDFCQKMQVARSSKKWTQRELAQKMNCKLSEIQSYEQNRAENPNRAFARKIERVLGTKLF